MLFFLGPGLVVSQAMTVTGYTAEANNRFSSGFPTAPVANVSPLFVGAAFNWSGVGWSTSDATKGFGFLSPKHYLVARHYGGASNIGFLGLNGELAAYSQAGTTNTSFGWRLNGNYDLAVGRLNAAIAPSDNVASYAVYDGALVAGQSVLIYGRGPNASSSTRVAATVIQDVFPGTITDQNGNVIGNGGILTSRDQVQLQSGDSGSPLFMGWTNPSGSSQLLLIGNHAAIDTTNGYNLHNLISPQNDSVNTLNASMVGQGYAVKLVGDVSRSWVGGSQGPSNRDKFNVNSNWAGGNVPTSDLYVRFDYDETLDPVVNFNGASQGLRGIYFTEGANSITLSNGSLALGRGGLTNYDASHAQILNVNTTLTAHQYWNGGGGGLEIQGNINKDGFLLIMEGSGNSNVYGVVSGAGGLAKSGTGTLVLREANTFTGSTWIHAGTLSLQDAGLLPSTTVLRVSQNNTARFEMNGASQTLGGLVDDGGMGVSSLALGVGGSLTVNVAADASFSGTITGGTSSSNALTKQGASHLTLAGNSSYEGITRVTAGRLIVASENALGAGGAGNDTIVQGIRAGTQGSLRFAASGEFTENVTLAFSSTGSTSGTFAAALVAQGSSTVDFVGDLILERQNSGTGVLSWEILVGSNSALSLNDITGTVTGSSSGSTSSSNRLQLTVNPDGVGELKGSISNGLLGGGGISLVLTGEGKKILGGSNSYTGITELVRGRTEVRTDSLASTNGAFGNASTPVYFGSSISSVNDALSLFATAPIEIGRNLQINSNNSGGTTTLGVDGNHTAIFSGNVDLRRNLRLQAASTMGEVRFSGTISETSGSFGIETSGPGKIVISNHNLFSGNTNVTGGTLQLQNNAALGSGSVYVSQGAVLEMDAGILVGNNILAATGAIVRKYYQQSENLGGLAITSMTPVGTTASLLGGDNATNGLVANLSFSEGLHFGSSDLLSLTGLNNHLFVLQLTFDPLRVPLYQDVVLGWNDSGIWKNAVLGNSTGGNIFAGNVPYNGTLELGTWGRDLENHTVWAVLNHNSQFMTISSALPIPEPASALLILFALGLRAVNFYRRK